MHNLTKWLLDIRIQHMLYRTRNHHNCHLTFLATRGLRSWHELASQKLIMACFISTPFYSYIQLVFTRLLLLCYNLQYWLTDRSVGIFVYGSHRLCKCCWCRCRYVSTTVMISIGIADGLVRSVVRHYGISCCL